MTGSSNEADSVGAATKEVIVGLGSEAVTVTRITGVDGEDAICVTV